MRLSYFYDVNTDVELFSVSKKPFNANLTAPLQQYCRWRSDGQWIP